MEISYSFRLTLIGMVLFNTKLAKLSDTSDLILSLQKYLNSELLLFASEENTDRTAVILFKRQQFQAFAVAVNQKIDLESESKSFRNTLLFASGSTNFLHKLNFAKNLTSDFSSSWVLITENEIIEKIKNINFPPNLNILLLKKLNREKFEILKFHKINENFLTSHFAYWEDSKLHPQENKNSLQKVDLQGQKFNIAFPLVGSRRKFQLWKLFSETMNFSLNWIPAPPGGFSNNGSKAGVFKSIERHELNGTTSNYVVTNPRLDFFDFIWPTAKTETKIYVSVNQNLNWVSFIAPFNGKVWVFIIIWLVFSTLVRYIIKRCSSRGLKNEECSPLFASIRALCYQSGKVNGQTFSYCISYLMPHVLAVVMFQHYCGVLQSYLTVKNAEPPFTDFEGVVKNGKYKISVVHETYDWHYFNNENGEEFTKIRNNDLLLPPEQQPKTAESGFYQLCKNGPKIFVSTLTDLNLYIPEKCILMELKVPLYTTFHGIMVWKGFPYKNVMTKLMKRLQLAGLAKWKYKYKIIPYDAGKGRSHFEPFPLKIIFPAFLVLLFSMILAGILVICEIMFNKILDKILKK